MSSRRNKIIFFKAIRRRGWGFTLVELLVVISIISLLSSIVFTSVNSARSKARYARALTDMKQIALAAELDFDIRGDYAPDAGAGATPAFVPTYLSVWPNPPCSNWGYDWDNWQSLFPQTVRITIVTNITAPVISDRKIYYCMATTGNCHLGSGGSPFEIPIQSHSAKTITCNE